MVVDPALFREQAERCRRLARDADPHTKERLLRLAEQYDERYEKAIPSERKS
jgi:hypothetical protein